MRRPAWAWKTPCSVEPSMRILLHAAFVAASAPLLLAAARAASPWKTATGFSTDWAHLTIEVQRLAPNVYLLHGSGGNVAVLTGPQGTLLVDDEFRQVAPKLE